MKYGMVEIGTIQRRVARPLRRDDTNKLRNGPKCIIIGGMSAGVLVCNLEM